MTLSARRLRRLGESNVCMGSEQNQEPPSIPMDSTRDRKFRSRDPRCEYDIVVLSGDVRHSLRLMGSSHHHNIVCKVDDAARLALVSEATRVSRCLALGAGAACSGEWQVHVRRYCREVSSKSSSRDNMAHGVSSVDMR